MSAPEPLAISLPVASDAVTNVEIAREAETHGYSACWSAEVNGPDAFTTLAAVAATTHLDLGAAVVPAQTRTPMVLGMTAVSLAQLCAGRFTLGIGSSSELIVKRWAGQPFDQPLVAVADTVTALQPMLSGDRSTHAGDVVSTDGFRPHATPPRGRVPLVVAAMNPRSCRQVGSLGVDGVCLNQLAPVHVDAILREVAVGAGGQLPDGYRVVARIFCSVTDDVPAARERVRAMFAPYVATSAYNRFYRWMGYEKEAQAVLEAGDDRSRMAAALSDALIDDLFCLGTADEVAARVSAYVDAGVTTPVIAPLEADTDAAKATLWAVATAYG